MKLATWMKLFVIIVFIPFLNSRNVFAQNNTPAERVLKDIYNKEDRENIKERYNQFIKNYSIYDFEEIYKMLSKSYLNGTQFKDKQDFVSYKESYYSDSRTRFVSFVTAEIAEATDNNSWIFQGCLTEKVEGKKTSVKSTLYIWRERDTYLFSDISPVVFSLSGKTQKCK